MGKEAVIYLLVLINHIFHTGDIPELLKTGVLTTCVRYLLQVDKGVMVTVTPRDSNNIINTAGPITMNGQEMKTVESEKHLGIHRTTTISKNSELNIEENLKKSQKSSI